MRYLQHRRRAFTLTEMLVAAALTLFIMALIATAYRAGLDTYTKLRVATGLSERLRTGSDVIKNDLAQEHFGGPYVPGFTGPRLSDQRLDRLGWVPPRQGYFMLYQGAAATGSTYEGSDSDALAYSSATSHILAFTSRRPAGAAESLFCASAPTVIAGSTVNPFPTTGIFYSRWAEITYFLVSNGDTIQPAGTPLHSLRRRERLLAPGADVTFTVADSTATIAAHPNLALIAASATQVTLIGSESIARRNRRLTHNGTVGVNMYYAPNTPAMPLTGGQQGDDILIPDVLSFEVKLTWLNDATAWTSGANNYSPLIDPFDPSNVTPANRKTDYPFSDLPFTTLNTGMAGQRIFDTFYRASNLEIHPTLGGGHGNEARNWEDKNECLSPNVNQPPLRVNVRGVQIKIRVWDYKAKTARQITFAVDQ